MRQAKAAAPAPVGTLGPRLRGLLSAWTTPARREKPVASLVEALARAKPDVAAKAKALVKAKPARRHAPRPVRSRGRRSWRPLAIKLLIGLGVASAAVAMQDKLPVVERRGGSTVLSQPAEPAPVIQFKGQSGAITGIAFADDGKWIVSTGADGTIKVWGAASRALVRTLELDAGPATAIATERRRAVTGHRDGSVALWDLETGEKLASYKRTDASIWSVAFTGDPERFAASGHDWTVMLFDARIRSAPVQVLEGHDSAVQALAYSPASHLLASGAADRTVKLWDPAVHRLIRTYRGHNDAVTAVSVSPDGRVLASASLDGAIRLWSTTSNRTHRILRGHRGRITALAFSPDGQLLVSAGDDGVVKLWEFRRGRSARNLHGHTGEVRSLSFAPDGRRLASAGSDGIVRLWEVGAIKPGS
jgi:WD40 repeat protein